MYLKVPWFTKYGGNPFYKLGLNIRIVQLSGNSSNSTIRSISLLSSVSNESVIAE